jgi:hypothetical protein
MRRLEFRVIELLRKAGVFLPEGTALLRISVSLEDFRHGTVLWRAWGPAGIDLHVMSRWPLSALANAGVAVVTDSGSGDVIVYPRITLFYNEPAIRRAHLVGVSQREKQRKRTARSVHPTGAPWTDLEAAHAASSVVPSLASVGKAMATLGTSLGAGIDAAKENEAANA